ncbi:hypothetical protein HanRHA438_Chr07g0301281 [Helianthus annuus]|nr:hypothetical protein HanRHA438_Chr07g0301281 [Helianthus annuus]
MLFLMKLCVNTRSGNYKYIMTQHIFILNVKWRMKKVVVGDYSNLEMPNSGGSTIQCPTSRYAAKKGKSKVSDGVAEQP